MFDSARNVLVVDDDDGMRRVYRQELTAQGYHVIQARDGKHALTILETSVLKIHLVVTDLNMPTMDGGRFILELLERGYHFEAVVLATAADSKEPVIDHLRIAIGTQFPFYLYSKDEPIEKLFELLR